MCRYDIESMVPRQLENSNPFCGSAVDNAFELMIRRIQQQETRTIIQSNLHSLVRQDSVTNENDGIRED